MADFFDKESEDKKKDDSYITIAQT